MKNKKQKISILLTGLIIGSFILNTTTTKAIENKILNNEPIQISDEIIEYDKFTKSLIDSSIITQNDLDTLSQADIDKKLQNAGMEIEPNNIKDPLYNLTPSQIENLTDSQWEEIEKALIELYGEDIFDKNNVTETILNDEDLSNEEWNIYLEKINSIITQQDWDTLSMAQLDNKLRNAGIEVEPTSIKDPLYNLTPSQIENLTDSQWKEFEKILIELYGEDSIEITDDMTVDNQTQEEFDKKINSIITEQDWDTLSMAQIDNKLRNAGIEVEPTSIKDPLYNLTPSQIENIPNEDWKKINEILLELYGEDYYSDIN